MKKCIHVVYIDNFFPELWELTYPTIEKYAKRIRSDINIITERKYQSYHINYEKMQVWEDGKDYDANFLLDADILIHEEFPDFTTIVPRNHVAFNDNYNASDKFNIKDNIFFQRDGRDVGIASNAVITYKSTHDLYHPLNLHPHELIKICKIREGDMDEYVLSHNLARFGLKYTGITWEDWQRYYFVHLGTGDKELALKNAKIILDRWKHELTLKGYYG